MMISEKLDPQVGSEIHDVIFEALALARLTNKNIEFNFNGINMSVQPFHKYLTILREFYTHYCTQKIVLIFKEEK